MKIVAGVDEVGRGSLIGPVYAAAVILNKSIDKKILRDSKKLSKSKRKTLAKYIKKNSVWAIGRATVKEIEKKISTSNENLCFVPFFKKAERIAIIKSSLPVSVAIVF